MEDNNCQVSPQPSSSLWDNHRTTSLSENLQNFQTSFYISNANDETIVLHTYKHICSTDQRAPNIQQCGIPTSRWFCQRLSETIVLPDQAQPSKSQTTGDLHLVNICITVRKDLFKLGCICIELASVHPLEFGNLLLIG